MTTAISVLGAGAMGRGIIETAAVHEISVHAYEVDETRIEEAKQAITKSVEKGIRRGKLSVDSPDTVTQRITWHTALTEAVVDVEFVIEAAPEDAAIKRSIFQELDQHCDADVVLASNTSSISITLLASATERADRVVGMHFFNPVPVMAPVEVVRGERTSDETITRTLQLAETMGKQAFAVADAPGFAVNRVLMPLLNEAMFALHEGVADAATIDQLTKLGCNHPMGPLELADFVGLDVCLSILRVLQRETGDPKFRPCPLLVRKVSAGKLGRKSGEGFHSYGG